QRRTAPNGHEAWAGHWAGDPGVGPDTPRARRGAGLRLPGHDEQSPYCRTDPHETRLPGTVLSAVGRDCARASAAAAGCSRENAQDGAPAQLMIVNFQVSAGSADAMSSSVTPETGLQARPT